MAKLKLFLQSLPVSTFKALIKLAFQNITDNILIIWCALFSVTSI